MWQADNLPDRQEAEVLQEQEEEEEPQVEVDVEVVEDEELAALRETIQEQRVCCRRNEGDSLGSKVDCQGDGR